MDFAKIISNYLEIVFQKYVAFEGRAGRPEFWYFMLVNVIIIIILRVISQVLGFPVGEYFGLLDGLYWLAILLPNLGVQVRRLHDTGKTGWWVLALFVPILGTILLIVFWAQAGQDGDNEYGSPPSAIA